MTSRERLLTALGGGQPDRVPVSIYEHSPFNDAWANREPSYAPLIELERRLGDMFVWPKLELPMLLGSPAMMRITETPRADGAVVRTTEIDTPRGLLRTVERRDPGLMTWWQIEPVIKSNDDIERVLSIPDSPAVSTTDAMRALQTQVGNRGVILFTLGDALGHVVGLFDYEDFVRRCMRDDGPIVALLAKAQTLILQAIRTLGDGLGTAIFRLWGPEYCGAPLMNPRRFFRRYVVEPDRAATELIHEIGHLSVIHCHGRLRDILDMIAETGADGLEPIETLPLQTADVTLAEVKARIGGRMCLMGGMQALHLETASPAEVREHVRQAIAEAGAGGGLILLPTSAPFMIPLAAQTLANAEAFYLAAHEFGGYA
jgi:hypothetical protein